MEVGGITSKIICLLRPVYPYNLGVFCTPKFLAYNFLFKKKKNCLFVVDMFYGLFFSSLEYVPMFWVFSGTRVEVSWPLTAVASVSALRSVQSRH